MIFAFTWIFLTFYRFLDRNIFPHFLAAITHSNPYKWKLGNKNTVKPRLTDTSLLQTVFFVPGERNPLHFLWFNPLNKRHLLSTGTLYGPISTRISGVDCSKETQFRLGSAHMMIVARVSVHCTKHARAGFMLAWENSQNFARPLLVSPRNVTCKEQAQKFHTDDMSLGRSGKCFWLVEAQPIRSTPQIWVVSRHQYGNSTLVLRGETSSGIGFVFYM